MYSKSFTLIELIIVIIVVGVLTISILPRLERDGLREGMEQVVRHIRYTQHMAMVNDVYDAGKPLWYKAMWRISFRSKNCYLVSSNTDFDMNYDRSESALDPLDKKLLYSNNKCIQEESDNSTMFLSDKYQIDSIEFNSACGDNRFIAFDYLGRPHKTLTKVNDLFSSKCTITFSSGARAGVIEIHPQTGYVKIKSLDEI